MKKFNNKKQIELIKVFCSKMTEHPMTIERMAHILWLCDLGAYRALGKSISGDTYYRGKLCPMPKHLLRTLDFMIKKGILKTRLVKKKRSKSNPQAASL